MRRTFLRCLIARLIYSPTDIIFGQAMAAEAVDDRTQIEAAVESYVTAFNERDSDKLASQWSPEGVYTSCATGEQVIRRDAIQAGFDELFASAEVPTLAVAILQYVLLCTGSFACFWSTESSRFTSSGVKSATC